MFPEELSVVSNIYSNITRSSWIIDYSHFSQQCTIFIYCVGTLMNGTQVCHYKPPGPWKQASSGWKLHVYQRQLRSTAHVVDVLHVHVVHNTRCSNIAILDDYNYKYHYNIQTMSLMLYYIKAVIINYISYHFILEYMTELSNSSNDSTIRQ